MPAVASPQNAPPPDTFATPTHVQNLFNTRLRTEGIRLVRTKPRVLQLNVGKRCNLSCVHCHVNAGPRRKEMMARDTLDRILAWQQRARLPVIDLTGGAPEMLPDFRYLVSQLRAIEPSARLIDRCNLTILLEPGYEDLGEFLAAHRVEIIASLPCYTAENVNAQRGDGVFDASIRALRLLNDLGYGIDPELPLHLVYNPGGPFLPGLQAELEADYQRELRQHFGIVFNQLYALANLPIGRFASSLRIAGKLEEYLELLANAFNPVTVEGLMCRDTISVSWRGEVFDCDFNQMLHQPAGAVRAGTLLWEIGPATLEGRTIRTGPHCFGCTAGAGSSCGGALVAEA
jgi:radical SAM/Cys-rich protein